MRRNSTLISLLLVAVLMALTACATHTQPLPEGQGSASADEPTYPDPVDLAAAHVEAIGGRAAVETVRGYHATGTAEIAGQGPRATVQEWVRPGEGWRKRWDVDGFGRVEQGFDGHIAWVVRPDRPADAMRDEQYREAAASRAVLHPETDLIGHLGSARTIDQREIAGRSTWEVRITGPSGSVQSRFYDEKTGMLRAVEREELLAGQLTRILNVYDDWRPVEGVLFAHRLTRKAADGREDVTVLESVTTEPVPPQAVRPPAEVVAAASEDRYDVEIERDVMVPMRGGMRLATDIHRPVGARDRLPVILIRTPYNKIRDGAATTAARVFAERGYVVVVQDERGKWASEGEFSFEDKQSFRNDGYDTVEWLVSQPWSTGRVGTYGCSRRGVHQYLLAAERHPAHVAMIPQAGSGAVGPAREGGAFPLSTAVGWHPRAGTKDRTDGEVRIPLPEALYHLPTIEIMRHYGVGPTGWDELLSKPVHDPWWKTHGYITESDRFATPALHVSSWYDMGADATLQLFNLMRRNAVDERTREHQYLIMSPMTHCNSERATEYTRVGELDVGDARFPYWETYLRWFDHWLKGEESSVTGMPRVQYYVTGANEWRSAEEWPVPGASSTRFYLRSGGEAGERMDDGVLSAQPPVAEEPSDRYVYDPADPAPSRGGPICCTGNPHDQPGAYDQSDIEQRPDVLVYTTPPLHDPLDVVGALRATLYVSSSAPDTDFTVKLVDVHPDGRAFNVQEGITRARYREGFDRAVWMRPGEVYEVEVDLHATAHRFHAGHRVRVEVSSSNFPRFDRNLNTGGDNVTETEWRPAENTIHHSPAHPSYLLLPVVAGERELPMMGDDTVHVAPPTGVQERDRARILDALERVRPGGTVEFAPGTYLIGGIIRVPTDEITLLGHPDGTVIRGCEPDAFPKPSEAYFACHGFELAGARQTVRNLTFEYTWHGLFVGCCFPADQEVIESGGAGPVRAQPGGHLIEGNTFRYTPNGLRVIGESDEPTVVRDNRFIDVYHAVQINGGAVHVLDNDITVRNPEREPSMNFPGDAINILPFSSMLDLFQSPVEDHTSCSGNIIAGNRIEGYPDGIRIFVADPKTSCRRNEISDNTIIVGRARQIASDSTIVGVPLRLSNWARAGAADGEAAADALVEDNLIEGNHIIGAEGIGIEILHASGNRIANNTMTDIQRREPFPGNTLGGEPERWREANGSAIWLSPGSDDNEIVGNTFEAIAGSAVVIEGGGNQVELHSPSDTVRDLGSGNQVSGLGRTPEDT